MKTNVPPEQLAEILSRTTREPERVQEPARVMITGLAMSWSELTVALMKLAICAIPALLILSWLIGVTVKVTVVG